MPIRRQPIPFSTVVPAPIHYLLRLVLRLSVSMPRHGSTMSLASVWYNKGVAEIKMLLYAEALSSFKTAVRLCGKPLYVRSVLLVLGLSKPRDKYVEEAAAFNPDPEVSKEAESLLQFVRGDAGNIRLPKDPDAFIRESVEAYHVATGV